jgi:hypothetical protein
MWFVKIALKAPYTFAVLAILLMIGGALSALQMPKDIFPAINIPVVGVIWTAALVKSRKSGRHAIRLTDLSASNLGWRLCARDGRF